MKIKKIFKWLLILALIGVVGFVIFLFKFLAHYDAPILHGSLDFNVTYKEGLNLDVYSPTTAVYDKVPVVLFFHGGAWIVGGKESVNNARFNNAFNRLRDQGYAIVSPGYTLAHFDDSPFPDCIEDAKDALDWVKQNAETYQFDLNNVGVFGESAGAHIGMMLALQETDTDIHLNYIIDVYGPTDLYQLYLDQIPLLDTVTHYREKLPSFIQENFDITKYLFGFDPAKDSIRTKNFTDPLSPVNFLHKAMVPTLIIHGSRDKIVPINQSIVLDSLLTQLDVPHTFHTLVGMDHGMVDATDTQKDSVELWIEAFVIGQYLE